MVLTPRQSSSTRAQVEPGAILLQLHCLRVAQAFLLFEHWPQTRGRGLAHMQHDLCWFRAAEVATTLAQGSSAIRRPRPRCERRRCSRLSGCSSQRGQTGFRVTLSVEA